MGLDMYLFRRKKFRENDPEFNELAADKRKEVCYWRKANEIRGWFVEHTGLKEDDNCRYIELNKELLEELRDDCLFVLENKNRADEVIPTTSGFFFGSTEYDEGYFEDLRYTLRKVDEILDTTDFDTEVIEYTDWW